MVNYKVGTPQLSLRQKVLLLVVLVLILLVVIVVVLVLIVLVPGAFNGQRQGWKAPGELEVSKSVECEIFPSVLCRNWFGDRVSVYSWLPSSHFCR